MGVLKFILFLVITFQSSSVITALDSNIISSLSQQIQRFLGIDNQSTQLLRRRLADDDDDAPYDDDGEPTDGGDDDEPTEDDDDCTAATFRVVGDRVIMIGEIVTGTESRLFSLLNDNPQVDTLVLQNVPGSCDDEAMFKLGTRVHHAGLKTVLPSDGFVASGGSDLLLAGVTRTINNNACIGVHSWCCDDRVSHVASLATNDGVHQPYIDFYKSVGFTAAEAANLYWFTITVAPSQGMHYLTQEEMRKLNIDFGSSSGCKYPDEGMGDDSFDFTIPPSIPRALGLPLSSEPAPMPVPMPVEDPETPAPVPASIPVEVPEDDDDEPNDDDNYEPMDDDDGDEPMDDDDGNGDFWW